MKDIQNMTYVHSHKAVYDKKGRCDINKINNEDNDSDDNESDETINETVAGSKMAISFFSGKHLVVTHIMETMSM